MKTNWALRCLTGLFLVLAFIFLGYQRIHKPRVFVLHSYHEKMPWVKRINQGITRVFKDKPYVSIRYFYMNTKKRHTRSYLSRKTKEALSVIRSWNPDVLITFDNDAQRLVGKYFPNPKKLKIIMAGVHDNASRLHHKNIDNTTSITEEVPVSAIREVLSLIFRHERKIYYLSDDSETSRDLEKNMLLRDWGSYQLVAHRRVKNFLQWKAAVKEANSRADILLLSVYHDIRKGRKNMGSKRLVTWLKKNSQIPIVGIYESFILNGGDIAVAISAVEQGYSAAWLAFNVIEKKIKLKDVPLLHGKHFSLYINKKALKKHFPRAQVPIILDTFSKTGKALKSKMT